MEIDDGNCTPEDSLLVAEANGVPAQTLQQRVTELATKLTITLDGMTCTFDLLREVTYNPLDLDTGFQGQAALTTKWSCITAKLAAGYARSKRQYKETCSRVSNDVRTGLIPIPKITEKAIEEQMHMDMRVQAAATAMEAAEEALSVAKAVVAGMKDRGEMLRVEGILKNTEARMTGITA